MKKWLFLTFCILSTAASAASTEDYYAARDDAISRIHVQLQSDGVYQTIEKDALAKLEPMLQSIIGPVAIKEFPPTGKINLDRLAETSVGFGNLDGLQFKATGDLTRMVVTTEPVFARWLSENETVPRTWFGPIPATIEDAARTNAFYSRVFRADPPSSIWLFGELPISQPKGADFAVAALAATSVRVPPRYPYEIVVTVRSHGRVMIVNAPLPFNFDPVPQCNRILAGYDARPAAGPAHGQFIDITGGLPAPKVLNAFMNAVVNFRNCYVAHPKLQRRFYGDAIARAQRFADLLAAGSK